jgi:hypothetical protein
MTPLLSTDALVDELLGSGWARLTTGCVRSAAADALITAVLTPEDIEQPQPRSRRTRPPIAPGGEVSGRAWVGRIRGHDRHPQIVQQRREGRRGDELS